mgnify:CR=1 FL=1
MFAFQSLFLWNIYFNEIYYYRYLTCNKVSILIFMEHLLQQLDNLEQSLAHSFVSILIFMEHLLQLFLNIKVGFFLIVSILIFMEHLLQPGKT